MEAPGYWSRDQQLWPSVAQAYFWLTARTAGIPLRHVAFSMASLAIGLTYLVGTFRSYQDPANIK